MSVGVTGGIAAGKAEIGARARARQVTSGRLAAFPILANIFGDAAFTHCQRLGWQDRALAPVEV